jgi:hypothetical protein
VDSYIVRVYRRDGTDRSPSRGVVEKVGAAGQEAFGTMQELWNILSGRRKRRTTPAAEKQE